MTMAIETTPASPMPVGRRFWKMSGSGNDFVFFDAMREVAGPLATAAAIGRLCERRTGIGADGVVFIEPHPRHAFMMRYFNRDGSLAEMCGNAALCSVRLATQLGIVPSDAPFTFETSSGPVKARMSGDTPEIDMVPVTELDDDFDLELVPGERRVGFARVGVPHLVLLVDDLEVVDVDGRGRPLRHLPSLRDGANVNFVGQTRDGRWAMRTYERGVEQETLACGTGAVAVSALLNAWASARGRVELASRSGRLLSASPGDVSSGRSPTLGGEGRVVFAGELGEL